MLLAQHLRCSWTTVCTLASQCVYNKSPESMWCVYVADVVVRWESLQLRAEELQQVRSLEREVAAVREDMAALASRVADVGELQDRDQLEARIRHVESALTQMVDKKSVLLHLNMAVHHFHTSLSGATDQQAALALKDAVAELYKVWDETYKRMSQYLSSLLQASETWKQFDVQLVELQTALRSDQVTLRVLDSALQGSGPSPDITSSVRDVAKVLSEKQAHDSTSDVQETDVLDEVAMASLTLRTGEGGSLSDSGISDSGSEQEMSEREKRLAVLRRLARNLETVLSPGCTALVNILRVSFPYSLSCPPIHWNDDEIARRKWSKARAAGEEPSPSSFYIPRHPRADGVSALHRIEQTEQELKNLQSTCRNLIFRTAVKGRSAVASCPSGNHVASRLVPNIPFLGT
ncbi:hypothetical protein PR048_003994 [Dryococelus australis]|uniref:Uncharacterized protein n=1 Tax=Dryococelus australis TaxID=614101 RepID=A0ABQ9I4B4_9NEOP|nr:hypothetical protein PR048_003994 [Dryococelus australis]